MGVQSDPVTRVTDQPARLTWAGISAVLAEVELDQEHVGEHACGGDRGVEPRAGVELLAGVDLVARTGAASPPVTPGRTTQAAGGRAFLGLVTTNLR